jgi:hypothetical protein
MTERIEGQATVRAPTPGEEYRCLSKLFEDWM